MTRNDNEGMKAIALWALSFCLCVSIVIVGKYWMVSAPKTVVPAQPGHVDSPSEVSRVNYAPDHHLSLHGDVLSSSVYEIEVSFAVVALPRGAPFAELSAAQERTASNVLPPVRSAFDARCFPLVEATGD